MKKIPLNGKHGIGKFALVDDDSYDSLNKFKWSMSVQGYAFRGTGTYPEYKIILMHRAVNGTPDGLHTDHINSDRLDNRKCNLRTVTQQENMWNRSANMRPSKTGLMGAHEKRSKFVAKITIDGKMRYLGTFTHPEDAHAAYLRARIERNSNIGKAIQS